MLIFLGGDGWQVDGVYGVEPVLAQVALVVERGAVGGHGQGGVALVEHYAHEYVVAAGLAVEGHLHVAAHRDDAVRAVGVGYALPVGRGLGQPAASHQCGQWRKLCVVSVAQGYARAARCNHGVGREDEVLEQVAPQLVHACAA